jgi:transposase, IS5 family
MRKRFEVNPFLNLTPIENVNLPLKSRDELPPILAALQYIFVTPSLNEKIFNLIEKDVVEGKKRTGRPGMDLWHILVLASVREGLDLDFDKLEDLANHHKLIRAILGLDDVLNNLSFKYTTLRNNVAHVTNTTLQKINKIVAKRARSLFDSGKEKKMHLKADTYSFECNVHFPTDLNLTWDCIRKCIELVSKEETLYRLGSWRKYSYCMSELKSKYRSCSCAVFSGGQNKEQRVRTKTIEFLEGCIKLSQKVNLTLNIAAYNGILRPDIDYFYSMLEKHIDLVTRRLLCGEKIPHEEKLFSIFETHTEWLKKGKRNPSVELGHRLLVTTDEHDLIVDYKVMINECDSDQVVGLIERIEHNFGQCSICSMSFDKGFSSKVNKEFAAKHVEHLCMPKKGKRNKMEAKEESQKQFVKLRKKHSAVESNINCLEHHGLDRCPDKGINAYLRYAGVGVLAYNLHKLGNFLIKQKRKVEKAA